MGITIRSPGKGQVLSGQTIKSYLLGSLDNSRRSQLEERLLNDGELFEELLISEDELVDQYVAGRLTDDEKRRFETHFLITADRHRKFQFGRTLNKYLELNDVSDPVVTADASRSWMFQNRPALSFIPRPLIAFSLIAILCLGIVAVYWTLTRRDAASSSPAHVVTLVPGAMRSEGAGLQRVQIPSNTETVELRLRVWHIFYEKYAAELRSGNGKVTEVASAATYQDQDEKLIVFRVEADQLPSDDYQLKLNGINPAGERELIDSYPFRVLKR